MQIFVTTPAGRILTLEVEGSLTVAALRRQINAVAQREGIAAGFRPSLQRIIFTDPLGDIRELRDEQTLGECGIGKESQLNLGMRPAPLPVGLNVGGERFTTMLSTLTCVRGSKLCVLFEGLAQAGAVPEGVPGGGLVDLPVDGQGAFVLDRDGPSFRFILNYLRDRIEAEQQRRADGGGGAEPEPEPYGAGAAGEPP
eukprot:COSAG04_NODE_7355_length_1141_cov_2.094050_2_plen_197_part_01